MPSSVERRELMLVPYILLSFAYMATFKPFFHLPPETLSAAILKAAPIWYLAAYVGLTPKFADNSLAQGVRVGLVLSSLGDIFLVWRHSLFLPGMFCFALAQMAYILGLKAWVRRGNYPSRRCVRETALLCVVVYAFLFTGMETWLMAACVLAYSMLLFTMASLSLQRHMVEGNRGSYSGVVGGIAFLVSDFLIGVDKWKMEIPMCEGFIMTTYYLAQGAITFGAVRSARAKRRE